MRVRQVVAFAGPAETGVCVRSEEASRGDVVRRETGDEPAVEEEQDVEPLCETAGADALISSDR